MPAKKKRKNPPRPTVAPGVPSVEEIEQKIEDEALAALTRRRADARRFSKARAEFSRRFCARLGLPLNPAALSAEDRERITTHPQYVDPVRCPMDKRMFALECQMVAA